MNHEVSRVAWALGSIVVLAVAGSGDDGTFDLDAASIASGDWRVETDDGTIDLDLPADEEIGYDVEARSDDGHTRIVLENSGVHRTADGGEAHARSTNDDERATQVRIDAQTDDGTIDIDSS